MTGYAKAGSPIGLRYHRCSTTNLHDQFQLNAVEGVTNLVHAADTCDNFYVPC